MHRHAFDNAAFQTALLAEPTPFCRGCHAPEANAVSPTLAADLGVACVTCHVTAEGAVLAGPGRKAAPHQLTRSEAFAGPASCAGCHEFPFPGATSFDDRGLMQTTMREHSRVASTASCTSCHRTHAFREARDPAWLAARLRVTAQVSGANIRLILEQTAPGHAFPTGDLFRRLAVKVGDETRYLARHFEGRRELTRDDRVFDTAVTLDFERPRDAKAVAWSVTLERVAGIGTGSEPARATIESSVRLHEGVVVMEKN